jgi:N-acetylneuraminic acid mutarotase
VFGGENAKRQVLDEVHLLNLTTFTWSCPKTYGTAPPARADHVAGLYNSRHLYVFGGGSSTRCFNDLYSLDTATLTWQRHDLQVRTRISNQMNDASA